MTILTPTNTSLTIPPTAFQTIIFLFIINFQILSTYFLHYLGVAVPRVCTTAFNSFIYFNKVMAFVFTALNTKFAEILCFAEFTEL